MMEIKELKTKEIIELTKLLDKTRQELAELASRRATGSLTDG